MKSFRSRLLATSAASAIVLFMADTAAYADCQPDPANDGDTVTCADVDADGFSSSSANLTVNVQANANVAGLKTGDGATVTIDGSVEGVSGRYEEIVLGVSSSLTIASTGTVDPLSTADPTAIYAPLGPTTINNTGTIFASTLGAKGININDESTVINSGQITIVNPNGPVTFSDSSYAIQGFGTNNGFDNSGSITVLANFATADGLVFTDLNATHGIHNSGSIAVTATNGAATAIRSANGTYLVNDGTVQASGINAYGIYGGFDSATIINNGDITATASSSRLF